MSPEQVRGLPVDHRTDIFAFGAMLFEIVSGRRAFHRATTADTISAILNSDPLEEAAIEPDIPAALRRIIARCVEKSAAGRFKSADDLAFALEALSSPSGTRSVTASFPRRSLLRSVRVAWSAAALLAVAVAVLSLRPAPPAAPVTRLDVVTPPTTEAFSFALSPDGRQLVFAASGEKGSQLWLRSLDDVAARPLPGTEGGTYPFWAPDGGAIGFFAAEKLKRLNLSGGAPQELADAPLGRGGTWNPDGVIVFAPTTTSPLMRIAATGGATRAVTTLGAGQGSHRWPQFLPDGRLLFLMALGDSQIRGTYVVSLGGGDPVRVLIGDTAATYAPPGYLLRVSQGILIAQQFDPSRTALSGEPVPVARDVGFDDGSFRSAFSVATTGTLAHRSATGARRQLAWVDRTGTFLTPIGTPDENALSHPVLSDNGQRVIVSRIIQGNSDLWIVDVTRGIASRFTFDAAVEFAAVWSPDGRRVVFASSRKGAGDLFEKSAGGAADDQPLLVDGRQKVPLDWSKDGRHVLFGVLDPKGMRDLWALPMTADRKPFPVVQTEFDENSGQFSPDGRWLAYTSNESGRYEVYVQPFPEASGKWQVSTAGGGQPRWRRDGQELFYVAPDGRLMAAPVRFVASTRTVDTAAAVALFGTRLATGVSIGSFTSTWFPQYAVGADGRFLMNVTVDEAVTSPIAIVLNWPAALRR